MYTQAVSVSVYYVAVRTIVLSRHGSNLARPVIIHGLIYVPSTSYCGFFGVSPDGNCTYVHWGSFTSNSKSVRRAIWFTWFSEPHDSVYGTWQSQALTHPLMKRARRCLTSVIEQISMSERRIPYLQTSSSCQADGAAEQLILKSCIFRGRSPWFEGRMSWERESRI